MRADTSGQTAVLENSRPVGVPVKQRRILLTGSRDWDDEDLIEMTLGPELPARGSLHLTVVLVHGDCPTGADAIGSLYWSANGGIEEPHPADWEHCGLTCPPFPSHRRRRANGETYCPGAGPRRNLEMVRLGADVCYAFIRGWQPGCHRLRQLGGTCRDTDEAVLPLTAGKVYRCRPAASLPLEIPLRQGGGYQTA